MKKHFGVAGSYAAAALCVVFLWSSMACAFEPEAVPAHPKLLQLSEDWKPRTIYQVSDNVYVAVGYARANPVLIEGTDGLIIIDPAESIYAAEIVKAAFNTDKRLENIFSRKPVKAIIYTHYHDCHIHGASVFAGNDSPEIISHENFLTNLYSPPGAVYSMIFPTKSYRAAKYMGLTYQHDYGYWVNGGIFPFSVMGPSGFLPPTKTVQDKLKTTIAGVNITLIHAPGETSDIIFAWLPDKKVIIQIGNFYKSFPAIVTLRGASFRNPLDYLKSIDTMRSLNAEYLVMIHSGAPLVGAENIRQTLTNFRDAAQFVHDQTVRNMNKGLTPGEIIEVVKELPPHLASDPYVQEYFGKIDRDIFQIFMQYMGWFTGKCRDLFPMSPAEQAREMAELAGGVEQLTVKAQDALTEGKLEWALILADDVLRLDSGNAEARVIKNSAMLLLAEGTYNAQTRNYLLSEYLEDTGQISGRSDFSKIDDNMVGHMPMDTLFGIMSVSLNATKSLDKDIVVGLHLTDLSADYTLHVRRGIEEVQAGIPYSSAFTITAESPAWKQVVLGKLYPQDAVERGYVVIAGSAPQAFYDFLNLFDLPAAPFTYFPQRPVVNQGMTFQYSGFDANIVSWKWSFGDHATGIGRKVTHSYASADNYTVTLTLTDENGGQKSTSRIIQVLPDHR